MMLNTCDAAVCCSSVPQAHGYPFDDSTNFGSASRSQFSFRQSGMMKSSRSLNESGAESGSTTMKPFASARTLQARKPDRNDLD